MQTPWEYRYAHRTQKMGSSVIRELLKLTENPEIISFGGGLPAPEVFPVKQIQEACNAVLEHDGAQALQYGTTEGYLPLREMICRHTGRYSSVQVKPENILITSGSQQALDFIGRLFVNRGDYIVVENPTYMGALQAWNAYGAQYITVPMDEEGMIVDELEKALRIGPKFIYVLPNFQNPSGATLSLERRQRIVELADKYGVPIVEDDPYGQLRYDGEHLPPLVHLDSRFRGDNGTYTGNVIYLSTFSKLLSPGLRVAWVIAPEQVIKKLVHTKQAADLHTATFNQIVAYEVGKGGFLNEHVKVIRGVYKERRDVMLETMEEIWPAGTSWTHPQGGMFLWGMLPAEMDTTEIFKTALSRKVAFVPGAAFHANGGGKNTMRLNFSYCSPNVIREGMTRLGLLLRELVVVKN